jgi:hypothetical protein
MKKLIAVVMTLLLVALMPVSVFAYKISNDLRVVAKSGGIPEGTVYIDVLLPKEAFGDRFVEFNDSYTIDSSYKFIAGLSQEPFESVELYADDEISQYRLDDYYSFLAHFDGAETEFGTEQFYTYHDYYYGSDSEFDCTAEFCIKNPESDLVAYHTLDAFSRAKKIKLAYIGEQGNILLITEPFSVKDKALLAKYFEDAVADGESIKIDYYFSPYTVALYIIIAAAAFIIFAVVINKKTTKKYLGELPPEEEN